jgi:hypothetical protein
VYFLKSPDRTNVAIKTTITVTSDADPDNNKPVKTQKVGNDYWHSHYPHVTRPVAPRFYFFCVATMQVFNMIGVHLGVCDKADGCPHVENANQLVRIADLEHIDRLVTCEQTWYPLPP